MHSGLIAIAQARAGLQIAIVTTTWATAETELERLLPMIGEDHEAITRSNGEQSVKFASGGYLQVISAGHKPRGKKFDEVYIEPNALTDDVLAQYEPTLATSGGRIITGDAAAND